MCKLGINHPSPLIYCATVLIGYSVAGNQSSIPFDILFAAQDPAWACWESIIHPL